MIEMRPCAFESLKQAVEQTLSEDRGASSPSVMEGIFRNATSALPFAMRLGPISQEMPRGKSGYVFEIHCKGMNGYVIDVQPDRGDLDGTRHF